MTALIREELVALLRDYQDLFAWSYQDMPGLNSDIVQHRLPLNLECSPVKKKLRRMKPEMSLKIKEDLWCNGQWCWDKVTIEILVWLIEEVQSYFLND